jgi:hypothetical protein
MLTVNVVSLVVFIYRPLIEAAVEWNVRSVPWELRHTGSAVSGERETYFLC